MLRVDIFFVLPPPAVKGNFVSNVMDIVVGKQVFQIIVDCLNKAKEICIAGIQRFWTVGHQFWVRVSNRLGMPWHVHLWYDPNTLEVSLMDGSLDIFGFIDPLRMEGSLLCQLGVAFCLPREGLLISYMPM